MVGGGTGAVMTAVTMIFEMTRDYSIVMPMMVAVAMSIGARRIDCACIAFVSTINSL
jgi:CIC family chloride channel protein